MARVPDCPAPSTVHYPPSTVHCPQPLANPQLKISSSNMSGVSFRGGTSRCFYEWQKFMECYSSNETEDPKQCTLFAEDYNECLHHIKEKKRAQTIAAEYERKKKDGDDVPQVQSASVLKDLNYM